MLQIYFGDIPESIARPGDVIYNTATYFKNVYQDDWFADDFAIKMIKSVDKSEVVDRNLIESKALGKIPPTMLSGGVKTLLLIYNVPDKIFNASTCGNNCASWLLRIARNREKSDGSDITVNLRHLMDFGKGTFSIRVLNSGAVVHNMVELIYEAAAALKGDAQ